MNRRITSTLSFLLLFLPWLLFYHNYLFFGKIYVAPTGHTLTAGAEGKVHLQQSYQRDRAMVLYPEWDYLHHLQKSAESLYWNPAQFSGTPLPPQSSLTDPLRYALVSLLGKGLPPHTLYMLAMMIRSALAITFAYLIFRHFGFSPLRSAAATGAVWFSAPILVLHHRTFDPTYLWLAILWFNLNIWSSRQLRRRLVFGLALALVFGAEIYTWHLHFAMLFSVLLLIFNGVLAYQRRGINRREVLVPFAIFAAAGLLAGCIGTFRIWTFLDALGYSYRTVLPKASGGLSAYIPFGVLYFPYLSSFQNALSLFTQVQLHPIHPELKRVICEFDNTRINFFPLIKTLGQVGAVYRSPLWYLGITFMFLDRNTRHQAFPFWATCLVVFGGYNALALFSPIFIDSLPNILKAGNWSYLLVAATHTCLSICFGFGIIGLWRLLRQTHVQPGTMSGDLLQIVSSISKKSLAKIALLAGGLAALGLGLIYMCWSVFDTPIRQGLYELVSTMHKGSAPRILSDLIRGGYPLDHYYRKLDQFWEASRSVLTFIFLVCVPLLVFSAWLLRFPRPHNVASLTRFRLIKILSVGTVLLLGYGCSYLLLGYQLHQNTPYLAEKLRQGLVEHSLDPQTAANTALHFQNTLQQLYNPLPGICLMLLISTLIGLGCLWYAVSRPTRRTPVLLALVLLLGSEGVLVTLNREDSALPEKLHPKAEWVEFLKHNLGSSRYLAHGHDRELSVLSAGLSGESPALPIYDLSLEGLAIRKFGLLKPSVDYLYGMESLDGSSSLVPNDYRVFTFGTSKNALEMDLTWEAVLQGRTELDFPFRRSRGFDLLSMKYLVTFDDLADPDYKLVYDQEVKIYENTRSLPRAWFVGSVVVEKDRGKLLTKIAQPAFDPSRTVLLEQRPLHGSGPETRYGWITMLPARLGNTIVYKPMSASQLWTLHRVPESGPNFEPVSSPGSVTRVSYSPGRISYRVETPTDQFLVLGESFYPGWKAEIDGAAADIYRANYALMAVPVPSGKHHIELSFHPRSYVIASNLSFASLFTCAGLLLLTLFWKPMSTAFTYLRVPFRK